MNWESIANIIVGSVPAVIAVGLLLLRLDRRLAIFLIEHESLMGWYARSHNMRLEDLPTRSSKH